MSQIFRLHSGGADNIRDWSRINAPLSGVTIDSIKDPAGADAAKQITSIPSPFARMDLVRVAFKQVRALGQLEGNTIYHRIVSDTLDVAQIFFNAPALRDTVEIIPWNPGIINVGNQIQIDPNSDLGMLKNADTATHRLFGQTLELFLAQDSQTYNFSTIRRLYLLNYKNGPEPVNIIGSTSPSTLFFSSPNTDLASYVNIQFGSDRVFDDRFYPLFRRDEQFVTYLYALKYAMARFETYFGVVDDYLNLCFPLLPIHVRDRIRSFQDPAAANAYLNALEVTYADTPGNNVEVMGWPLRNKAQEIIRSDFEIVSEKATGVKPLVLPNEQFNEPLAYAGGQWQHDYRAPYADPLPLGERTLPHQPLVRHPYLTVSDLLQPYIIRLPYPINKEKFHNGYFVHDEYGYALPLKKEFFHYFSVADLERPLDDGRRRFELMPLPNDGVKAVLRIPIKNGPPIEWSRNYLPNQFSDKIQPPDESKNKGVILHNLFGLTIFPFIRTGHEIEAHYRIMLADKDATPLTRFNEYNLNFFKDDAAASMVPCESKRTRSNKGQGQDLSSSYYVLNREFDMVQVSVNTGGSGMLVPKLKQIVPGNKKFTFAIDFGTTNTHVEYAVEEEREHPFEIKGNEIQVGSLNYHDERTIDLLKNPALGFGADILVHLMPKEFVPEKIEKGTNYTFPQRTVIADEDRFDPEADATYSLADFNIPFGYLKESLPHMEITANLKWADFQHNKKLMIRTRQFIDTLLFMIRNKVLLGGGSLDNVRLIWFYPSSMSTNRKGMFHATWSELAQKYFSKKTTVDKMSESIAPFYYYRERAGILAYDKPVACVDIGGGTTDIVIYRENLPVHLTSFKYAANAVFGDGYGNSPANNGFVKRYEPRITTSLSNSTASQLNSVLYGIRDKHGRSIELIEFFFSLESNERIKANKIPISFAKDLAGDTELKVVFLLFYASIIYHLARLMRSLQLEPPRFITFSGTGSKILNITDPSPGIKTLTDFTKLVFEEVYGTAITTSIEIKQFEDPKEITCKGGLLCNNYAEVEEIEKKIRTVLIGDTGNTLVHQARTTYADLGQSKLVDDTLTEVQHFITKFFQWNATFNYHDRFGINPGMLDQYKAWLTEDLKLFLKAGLKEKNAEVGTSMDSEVEETLFFYPLIGALNKLAFQI